jgi:hypothetical protein
MLACRQFVLSFALAKALAETAKNEVYLLKLETQQA